jgi:hypothetical protein
MSYQFHTRRCLDPTSEQTRMLIRKKTREIIEKPCFLAPLNLAPVQRRLSHEVGNRPKIYSRYVVSSKETVRRKYPTD